MQSGCFLSRLSRPALALAAVILFAAPASAVPLVGDESTVKLTGEGDFAALGIGISAIAPAFENLEGKLVLPVIGGDLSFPLLDGTIVHDGGILLDDGFTFMSLTNLVWDLTQAKVFGDIDIDHLSDIASPSTNDGLFGVEIFELRECIDSTASDPCVDIDDSVILTGLGMDVTSLTASVINEYFSLSSEDFFEPGDRFGVSYHDVRVPEPTAGMLLVVAGALGLALRRRR